MKEKRNIYLTNIPLKEAQESYMTKINFNNRNHTEVISVSDALGRITAKPVFAHKSSPYYNAAAMDGIAVIAEKTHGATEINPLQLKINDDFVYINTGGELKHPFNAVIMIEDIVIIDENTVEIVEAAKNWQHVRPIGEDIVEGELIVAANHEIRPVDMGALLAGHIQKLEVLTIPRVGIIPTGAELIHVKEEVAPGKIIDSNSSMFQAMVKQYGGAPQVYPIVRDDYEELKAAIINAVTENDLVIINAGSSAGSKDFTVDVLREIGEVVIHGVATKPGKPVILSIVQGKPVVGIPGYPVSAYFTVEFFIKPLIAQYQHKSVPTADTVEAILSRRIVSSLKYEEYVRMKLGRVGEKLIATPLDRGAGVTMSLVRADGVLVIPQHLEGYEGGSRVEIQLLKPLKEIQQTIVSIGSHDLVMDLLSNQLQEAIGDLYLSSAHVGSLGGIMAMKKEECHLAPIHLLDTTTGEYNRSYVKQYLKGQDLALIKFVGRSQGIMVAKGNPKNIKGIADLKEKGIQFVNRQRGAGTRILLDYLLEKHNIPSEEIMGYEREMTTHMAVAAAIEGETADCGLGILSAAQALGLDFIPLAWEDYDLLIPQKLLKDEKIQALLRVMTSEGFKERIASLGGYRTDEIGKIIELN